METVQLNAIKLLDQALPGWVGRYIGIFFALLVVRISIPFPIFPPLFTPIHSWASFFISLLILFRKLKCIKFDLPLT